MGLLSSFNKIPAHTGNVTSGKKTTYAFIQPWKDGRPTKSGDPAVYVLQEKTGT